MNLQEKIENGLILPPVRAGVAVVEEGRPGVARVEEQGQDEEVNISSDLLSYLCLFHSLVGTKAAVICLFVQTSSLAYHNSI